MQLSDFGRSPMDDSFDRSSPGEKLKTTIKRTKTFILIVEISLGLIVHIIFAILFGLFSYNKTMHGPNCQKELVLFSKLAFFYHLSGLLISLITLYISVRILFNTLSGIGPGLGNLFRAILGPSGLIIYVFIIIGYQGGDRCELLYKLAYVYIIAVPVTIVFLVLVVATTLCCGVACLIGLFKSSRGDLRRPMLEE